MNKKEEFWQLINAYIELCGGDPAENLYGNTKRQQLVVKIESLVFPSDK